MGCVQCGACTVWGEYSVGCVQCGVCTVWGMYSVGGVQCGACTVWGVYSVGVYSVGCVQCGVCTVWGVYNVRCLYSMYRMRFNFRGVYISQICNFRVFRVFKFAVAGYSGVEIFAGEIFAGEIFTDIRSESVYHNSTVKPV